MRNVTFLCVLLSLSVFMFSGCDALFIQAKGPKEEAEQGKKDPSARVEILGSSSSSANGSFHYRIVNTGGSDLSFVSFNVDYKVDLTPMNMSDNLFKEYSKTITYSQQIKTGQTHYSEASINLKTIDKRLMSDETVTFTSGGFTRKTFDTRKTITLPDKSTKVIYGQYVYSDHAANIDVTVNNTSDQTIEEMAVEVLVSGNLFAHSVSVSQQGYERLIVTGTKHLISPLQTKKVIHVYNVPAKSSKTVKAYGILLNYSSSEGALWSSEPTKIEVLDKRITKPEALYETLDTVTVNTSSVSI